MALKRLIAAVLVGLSLTAQAAAAPPPPVVSLALSASDGQGHHFAARLSCRGGASSATGYLRLRARAACTRARAIAAFLESQPSGTRQCTEIYGGPDTARIRGRIGGAAVDRSLARTDGCAISDWTEAGVLLPRSRFAPIGIR